MSRDTSAPGRASGEHDTVFLPAQALREESRRTAPPTAAPSSLSALQPESLGLTVAEENGMRTLLDATLSALLVPGESTWLEHTSGLVCVEARPERPVSFDGRGLVARSGGALTTAATQGFSRTSAGRVMLGPRVPGEQLQLLDLAGERLIVQDRYVLAWSAPASDTSSPLRHPAPWPLELLAFGGQATLVLGLPQSFLAYDVHPGDDFEVRPASLVGWAGDLDVRLDGAPGLTSKPARFSGNGTVLFVPTTTSASLTERRMF